MAPKSKAPKAKPDLYLRDRIENITESDFWSALRPSAALRGALSAARAGRRADAYRLLGQYHAQSLAGEADAHRQGVGQNNGARGGLANLRRRADLVRRHDITGWHTHRIKFGKIIDFNADFGRSGQYGFHYLGWLAPVRDMWTLTGRREYRDCFAEIITQYYDQRNDIEWRIPSLHPVYYELGSYAKTAIILPFYAMAAGDPALDVKAREAMLKLLLGFARSLYRLNAGGYRAGNWQIVGSATLYWIGASFPEFREAAAWRRRGENIVALHAEKDFFADGGHGERCWGYGHMSLEGMLKYYDAASRHGYLAGARLAWWKVFFKRCYRWYAATTTPSRHMLNYGDGGIGDVSHIIREALGRFPELGRGPGLLGVDRASSNILRPSGYAFMRAGDRPADPFMSINFGPYGGGHTHDDLLDFTIWRYGQPLIEEVGRFGSYDNPLDSMFRSARSHNQIVIEHRPFKRAGQAARDVKWFASENLDWFSAWHEVYAPTRIMRQIVFVKPHYWVVFDQILDTEYIFQASAYLHAGRPFLRRGPGRWRTAGSPACLVAYAQPERIRRAETGTDYNLADFGPLANNPAQRRLAGERHRLGVMTWNDVGCHRPLNFAALLMPFRGAEPRAIIRAIPLKGSPGDRAAAFQVDRPGATERLVFNPARAAVCCGAHRTRAPLAVQLKGKWIEPH